MMKNNVDFMLISLKKIEESGLKISLDKRGSGDAI